MSFSILIDCRLTYHSKNIIKECRPIYCTYGMGNNIIYGNLRRKEEIWSKTFSISIKRQDECPMLVLIERSLGHLVHLIDHHLHLVTTQMAKVQDAHQMRVLQLRGSRQDLLWLGKR